MDKYIKPEINVLEILTRDILCYSGGAQVDPVVEDDDDLFNWE